MINPEPGWPQIPDLRHIELLQLWRLCELQLAPQGDSGDRCGC